LDFLKRCFKEIAGLRPYSETEREIRSKARELANIRDYIVLGHLTGYDQATGVYGFGRLDNDKSFRATTQELMLYARAIGSLADLSHRLFKDIDARRAGQTEPDHFFRRLWGELRTLLPFYQ
jgi:hypothetical protein